MSQKNPEEPSSKRSIPEILRYLSHKFRTAMHRQKEEPSSKKKRKPFKR